MHFSSEYRFCTWFTHGREGPNTSAAQHGVFRHGPTILGLSSSALYSWMVFICCSPYLSYPLLYFLRQPPCHPTEASAKASKCAHTCIQCYKCLGIRKSSNIRSIRALMTAWAHQTCLLLWLLRLGTPPIHMHIVETCIPHTYTSIAKLPAYVVLELQQRVEYKIETHATNKLWQAKKYWNGQ